MLQIGDRKCRRQMSLFDIQFNKGNRFNCLSLPDLGNRTPKEKFGSAGELDKLNRSLLRHKTAPLIKLY